jgi:hypothetical protein
MLYAVLFPVLGRNTKSSKTLKCRSYPIKHEPEGGAEKDLSRADWAARTSALVTN